MKAALIMLAALPLLAAGGGNGTFSGQVFGGNGTGQLSDAIVTVSTPSGFVASVVTNKTGEFSFDSLPQGEYNFRVTAHGYAIYERDITAGGDTGVKGLVVRLVVPSNKQTVSVAELRNPHAISMSRGF
ncbi:MAG TPA: carboxypeptidase-like regulatory domain-containing protein [Bryobacteraceae bacterium]|jgi:hypothetical protein